MFIWKFLCFCNFFITKYCIILGVSQKGQESKPNRISNSPSVIDASVNSSKKSKSVIEEDSSNFNRSSKSVNLQVSLNSSGNSTSPSKSPNSSSKSFISEKDSSNFIINREAYSKSVNLQVSLNSSGNSSLLTRTPNSIISEVEKPSNKSVNLQVSLTDIESDNESEIEINNGKSVIGTPNSSKSIREVEESKNSVNLQVSISDSESDIEINSENSVTRTPNLLKSIISGVVGEPSKKSVNLQVSLTHSDESENEIENDVINPVKASFTDDDENDLVNEFQEQNDKIDEILQTLGNTTSETLNSNTVKPKAKRNIFGNRLEISTSSEDSPGSRPLNAILKAKYLFR